MPDAARLSASKTPLDRRFPVCEPKRPNNHHRLLASSSSLPLPIAEGEGSRLQTVGTDFQLQLIMRIQILHCKETIRTVLHKIDSIMQQDAPP